MRAMRPAPAPQLTRVAPQYHAPLCRALPQWEGSSDSGPLLVDLLPELSDVPGVSRKPPPKRLQLEVQPL